MSSLTTSFSRDSKSGSITKAESRSGKTTATVLAVVAEEDKDEAQKIAGDERNEITQEEDDAVKRKVDLRVVPLLAAVYFSQFLDKNSLNYSSVMGLPIKGEHYNLVSMAFYLGFLVFEIPTSTLAQHFPLAKYLGVNMVLWATCLILHAASADFVPFFILRVLLGVFECCVSPILIAMIAAWYKKGEQAKRVGFFYVMNGVTSIIGGLMAYGVTFYKGTAVAHWRIMYFLLGGLAYVVAICVLIWLPDSPATASFLTEREKLVAIERVRDNQSGTVNKHFKKPQAIEALKDVKTWLLVLLSLLSSVPNGALASFNSILIKSFGYDSRLTLLLNVPQGFIAAITTLTMCYWADRTQSRMLPVLGAVLPAILGAAVIVGFSGGSTADHAKHKGVLLFGIMIIQTYGTSLALFYSWSASNIAGGTKKTVVNALFLTSFGISNVVGTQIFTAASAPGYVPGKVTILVLFSAMIPTILAMRWYTLRANRIKRGVIEVMIKENGWSEEDVQREADRHAFLDLTDKENPFFMYTS
ncbi:hypothetical protein RQP46_007950 [Phenoliferia psychrophenolica]